MPNEHVDVLIVGAGLSGIGAAVHLKRECPTRSVLLIEARDDIGGTWDLFRYPGVRSDSDMYTLGYVFRPWTEAKAIADAPAIMRYLRETARDHGVDRLIRFRHRARRANWSSAEARWTVEIERGEAREAAIITCNFLYMCSGYYRYEAGYTPEFADVERYRGRIVHPQHWTPDIDHAGKRVLIIGSGATAVTLVPALAQTAAHVTMLQRSPTYMVSRPAEDRLANRLRRWLPGGVAYALTRWKNVLLGMYVYAMCKRKPDKVARYLIGMVRAELGRDFDVGRHFTPRYKPWDQRLCLVPDGDLFKALREKRASVVTDTIERFTETGVRLTSGATLDADLVVMATGLDLLFMGGMEVTVDGCALDVQKTIAYKGMMLAEVPNLALSFGYTNASWTLKADLIAQYVCRLLNRMQATGTRQCTPRLRPGEVEAQPWVDFSSGYFQRGMHRFPHQGSKMPWKLHQNYVRDLLMLRHGSVDDGVMEFSNPAPAARQKLAA